MEHRLYQRKLIELDAFIYQHTKLIARGAIRNLSQDGVFVQIVEQCCPVRGCVEIKFFIYFQNRAEEQVLPALVAHHSDKGVGLIFSSTNDKVSRDIDQLLKKMSLGSGETSTPSEHYYSNRALMAFGKFRIRRYINVDSRLLPAPAMIAFQPAE
ncbi:MAG: hypothetical protein V3V12_04985 [Gammaproteobacteria bacterium]